MIATADADQTDPKALAVLTAAAVPNFLPFLSERTQRFGVCEHSHAIHPGAIGRTAQWCAESMSAWPADDVSIRCTIEIPVMYTKCTLPVGRSACSPHASGFSSLPCDPLGEFPSMTAETSGIGRGSQPLLGIEQHWLATASINLASTAKP